MKLLLENWRRFLKEDERVEPISINRLLHMMGETRSASLQAAADFMNNNKVEISIDGKTWREVQRFTGRPPHYMPGAYIRINENPAEGERILSEKDYDKMAGSTASPDYIDTIRREREALKLARMGFYQENLTESKLRVFDFDDTLAKSDSQIIITADGETFTMTPAEYAVHEPQEHYEYDFSEFDEVINPREIKQITNIVRNALNAGTEGREIAVLTARAPEAEEAIRTYLDSIGLDTSKITFELLGDSDPQAKAEWIAQRIEGGADDVLFFDDSGKNVAAVQDLSDRYPDTTIRARKVKYAEDIEENLDGSD